MTVHSYLKSITWLARPEMKLFRATALPGRLIGEDKHGGLVHWPAEPRGFAQRTPYTGPKRQLEEIDPKLARGTGWPGARGGRLPLRGAPSKPLTIRVTDQERGAWQRAAAERERSLGEWIREICNTEAADPRPRSKIKP